MDAAEYRREVALILQEAARCHLIEERLVIKPGGKLQPLSDLGNCLYLVDRLAVSDMDRRRWMAVEFLQPELGSVITCLRVFERAEARMQPRSALGALEARVTSVGTAKEQAHSAP
jgi:hypothetical protein